MSLQKGEVIAFAKGGVSLPLYKGGKEKPSEGNSFSSPFHKAGMRGISE